MHRYTVHSPLKINGTILHEGAVVELDDQTAPSLVRKGLVSPVIDEPVLAQTGTAKRTAQAERKAKK